MTRHELKLLLEEIRNRPHPTDLHDRLVEALADFEDEPDSGNPNNSFLAFADRELRATGYAPDAEVPVNWVYDNVMELMRTFSRQGHSGNSASWVRGIFNLLADFKPLSPLTGAPEEWMEVGEGVEQNRRLPSVFRENGQVYDGEGKVFRTPTGSCYTSIDSRVPVTFPYTQHRVYVDVEE